MTKPKAKQCGFCGKETEGDEFTVAGIVSCYDCFDMYRTAQDIPHYPRETTEEEQRYHEQVKQLFASLRKLNKAGPARTRVERIKRKLQQAEEARQREEEARLLHEEAEQRLRSWQTHLQEKRTADEAAAEQELERLLLKHPEYIDK